MEDIKLDPHNYRIHGNENKKLISKSLLECGTGRSIVVDRENVIIAGNGVYEKAQELGIKVRVIESDGTELIAIKRTDISTEDEKRKLLALADNRTSDLSEFDFSAIAEDFEIKDLEDWSFDLEDFSFDGVKPDEGGVGSLQSRFIIPPFSIFNTTLGYWQDRKKEWLSLGIKSEEGRDKEITFNISSQPPRVYEARNAIRERTGVDPSWDELIDYCNKHDIPVMEGTSIFDPVLCEICYRWFNISKGKILDPFSGGSVRGIVAAMLGYNYTGVDLRDEQIKANYKNADEVLCRENGSYGTVEWFTGDSCNIDKIVDGCADMIFSCPPYADLEVYSDDPKDLSNMGYEDFLKAYRTIIRKSCDKLNEDRFAVFVVGDVRDKQGFYRNFVSNTIDAFQDAGLHLYNEIILVNMIGSLAMRAGKQFANSRKVGKQHQNVLVFYKGDPKKIKENYLELDFSEYDFTNQND